MGNGISSAKIDEFHSAIEKGDYELVEKKLEAEPKLANAVGNTSSNEFTGNPPLMVCIVAAARRGTTTSDEVFLKIAELLLSKYKCDKNAQEAHGFTALHIAAEYANIPFIKLLLKKHKCSSTIRDGKHRTAFEMLVANLADRSAEQLKLVVAGGGDNKAKAELSRLNNLLCDGIVEFLAEADDLERDRSKFADNDGNTPLHHLARGACVPAIGELLTAGFSAAQVNKKGETPILYLLRNTRPMSKEAERMFRQTINILLDAEKFDSEEKQKNARTHYVTAVASNFEKRDEDFWKIHDKNEWNDEESLLYEFVKVRQFESPFAIDVTTPHRGVSIDGNVATKISEAKDSSNDWVTLKATAPLTATNNTFAVRIVDIGLLSHSTNGLMIGLLPPPPSSSDRMGSTYISQMGGVCVGNKGDWSGPHPQHGTWRLNREIPFTTSGSVVQFTLDFTAKTISVSVDEKDVAVGALPHFAKEGEVFPAVSLWFQNLSVEMLYDTKNEN